MPIQETIEAVEELLSKDLRVGVIFVNRVVPALLPDEDIDAIAEGQHRWRPDQVESGRRRAPISTRKRRPVC